MGVKVTGGLFTVIVILLSEALAIHFSIIQYHMWSFFISLILAIAYLLIGLGISSVYRRMLAKEGMVSS